MKINLTLYIVILFPYLGFAQPVLERNEINLFPELNQIGNYNSFQKHRSILNSEGSNYPGFYHVITDIPMDFFDFGSSIFSKESIVPVVLLSTVTTGLIFCDHKSWERTKEIVNRSNSFNSFTHTFVETGDAKWHLGLSGAALMFGYLTDDTRLQNTAFQTAEAVIASGLFVQLLKRISGRESPAVYTSPGGYWDLFPDLGEYQHRQPEYYAFPSGHITSATAFLTVITENYSEVKWLKPVSYGILGLLGISLVAHDMHWYSDLPLGLAIGYSFGKIISKRYTIDDENVLSKKNISIMPSVANGNYSILVSYSF
ncbi:MAG: phosphatase PAP2 family protein [Melioribacteraceae bacterium]